MEADERQDDHRLEELAARQLSGRIHALRSVYAAASSAAQSRWDADLGVLLSAYGKYVRAPHDCPLTASELVRCCHKLSGNLQRVSVPAPTGRQQTRGGTTAAPIRPQKKSVAAAGPGALVDAPPRPVKGPHPAVRRAMERQQTESPSSEAPVPKAKSPRAKPAAKPAGKPSPKPAGKRGKKAAAAAAAAAAPDSPETKSQTQPARPTEALRPFSGLDGSASLAQSSPPPSKRRRGPPLGPPIPAEVIADLAAQQPKVIPVADGAPSPEAGPASAPPSCVFSPLACPTPALMPADLSLDLPPALGALPTLGKAPRPQDIHGRFPLADEGDWKAFLRTYGWAVIGGVSSAEEVERLTAGFWEARDKDSGDHHWGGSPGSGQWLRDGAGHEKWVWDAREASATVFEKIYKTEKLLTSFEGFSAAKVGHSIKSGHWHVDQLPSNKEFECFQGFLCLTDVGDKEAGFHVVPGSKKLFTDGRLSDLSTKGHHGVGVVIPNNRLEELVCSPVKVNCKAGDFVIWDSRTIHSDQPASEEAPKAKGDAKALLRLAVYVSMVPVSVAARAAQEGRDKLGEKSIANRRTGIEEGRTTTHHWACRPVPGHRARPEAVYQAPILTSRQLRLAGLVQYDHPDPKTLPYSRQLRCMRSPMGRPRDSGSEPPIAGPVQCDDALTTIEASCNRLAQRLQSSFARSIAGEEGGGGAGGSSADISNPSGMFEAARKCVQAIWIRAQQRVLQDFERTGSTKAPAAAVLRQVDEVCRQKVQELGLNATRNPAIVRKIFAGEQAMVVGNLFDAVHLLLPDGGEQVRKQREEHQAQRTIDPLAGVTVEANETCRGCEQKDCVYYFTIETGGVGKPKPKMVRSCTKCSYHEDC
eukprot:Hpha_TRINITY_DN15340_c0_g2::TRINITY_DN15340_c0_g2_i1::g.88544::m.88544